MNLFPENIRINGKDFTPNQFVKNNVDTEWEKSCLGFLKEWYSPKEFIEVKTSGSTGKPKTICLKKEYVAASAHRTLSFFGLKKGDRILHCLPSGFIAGKLMIVRALIGELDLILVDPKTNFQFIKSSSFAFAAMVPNQVLKLLKIQPDLWKLKSLLIGGDAISKALEKKLQSVPTKCFSSYGMTETATHIALRKINGKDSDFWYRCLDEIKVGISLNECLQVFMPGLQNAAIQTNDLAELRNNKTFKIRGRADNVIISGGIKYSPELIEKKLEAEIESPFLIASIPHEKLGQQIVLLVETKENEMLRNRLNSICKKMLDNFEQPRKIFFVAQFPRTKNGKISRKVTL